MPFSRDTPQQELVSISLLDIFGFESMQINSFEQLCINYANEKLYHHFSHHVFKIEQEEYAKELPTGTIDQINYKDNSLCLTLFESRQEQSLFRIMDEELMMKGKNDRQLLEKFDGRLTNNKHYRKAKFGGSSKFTVSHYAGDVEYDVDGFLTKNADAVND